MSKDLLPLFLAALFISACASTRVDPSAWIQLDQWDSNDDGVLNRDEFEKGYKINLFANTWTEGQPSTTCSALSHKMFSRIDRNSDTTLDSAELTRRPLRYLVGTTYPEWKRWDDNGDNRIDAVEYTGHVFNEHLCGLFDPNSDGIVSSDDLALANFSICDQDRSETIGGMEFYLWEIRQGRESYPVERQKKNNMQ